MKKSIFVIVAVIILSVFTYSCNQDLLNTEQRGVINSDRFYENATDAQAQALIAYVYKQAFTITGISGWYYDMSFDVNATGVTVSNVSVSSQNHAGNARFTSLYRINYLCNMIIDKMNEDSNEKTIITGEAYFWRAWAYMYLIQMYGTPPLVDHVLTGDLNLPNGDRAALWNYVETSFQEAVSRLPVKSSLDGQRQIGGRVTKHSAYAALGKAQLWKGDYAAAISSFEQVINSNLYDLIDDYSAFFRPHADFCKEYMWELSVPDNDQANHDLLSYSHMLNSGWRGENVRQPGGIEMGFGSSMYNKEFYDFMIARGEKGKNRYLGTIWDQEDVLDKFISIGEASNRTEAYSVMWGIPPHSGQGYFPAKHLQYAEDLYESTGFQDYFSKSNIPMMRFSDVLLCYAEACALSGTKASEGLAALNRVRVRAGLDPFTALTLQDVKDEKRAELIMEGERYFDLIRWGDTPTAVAGRGFFSYQFYGYKEGTDMENGSPSDYDVVAEVFNGAQNFVVGRDELFPFPYSEMNLNENLRQNPNWE